MHYEAIIVSGLQEGEMMKRKIKMNGLYKTAFILLLVCLVMFIAAIIFAYLFRKQVISAVFSVVGVFLAFLGIVFATKSKPKTEKMKSEQENTRKIIDKN